MRFFGSSDNKIIHGDALQALSECISDNSVDLVFADPPYNIGKNFAGCLDKWDSDESYLHWCYNWLDLCIQKLKPTGALYVMTSTQFGLMTALEYKPSDILVLYMNLSSFVSKTKDNTLSTHQISL